MLQLLQLSAQSHKWLAKRQPSWFFRQKCFIFPFYHTEIKHTKTSPNEDMPLLHPGPPNMTLLLCLCSSCKFIMVTPWLLLRLGPLPWCTPQHQQLCLTLHKSQHSEKANHLWQHRDSTCDLGSSFVCGTCRISAICRDCHSKLLLICK